MDSEDVSQSQETLRELAKAQKTLDEVENKMSKFKSKKKENATSHITKAPFPDLHQYFSYLSEDNEDQPETFSNFNQTLEQQLQEQQVQPSATKPNFNSLLNKQNNSLTINQKLQKQKNSSIAKIQEYYIERNQTLEERLKQLKELKQKIIKDQKLLLRNNQELEEEIEKKRTTKVEWKRGDKLKEEIEKMKNKIKMVEKDNQNIGNNKKQLQKYIKQALKGHKGHLKSDIQGSRPKSSSEGRCQWH